MILSQAQEVSCLCGRVRARLDAPGHLVNGLISGPSSQFQWLDGVDHVADCSGWQLCTHCGKTLAHFGSGWVGIPGYLNQRLDAVHKAVEVGDLDKVQELLARGLPADLELKQATPLMLAARDQQLEICQLLLEHGAMAKLAVNDHFFAQKSPDLLGLLLRHGVDPQRLLRPVLNGWTVQSAKILLDAGVDLNLPDERGFTALHTAANNSTEMVGLVLQHGARFGMLSRGGGHPLGFCALWGYSGRLKVLLEAGFPVDLLQQAPADSALFAACREGHYRCASILLEFGADPNLRCADVTPLMAASQQGSLALVNLLLQAGADPEARDAAGNRAFNYATEPAISGRHRLGTNSTGEPTVELSYGRGRWTRCHAAIAERLPGRVASQPARLEASGERLHSMDFTVLREGLSQLDAADRRTIRRAARAGCLEAQFLLGFREESGWLRMAALRNHPEALYELASLSQKHRPKLLERAAELGSLHAMRELAVTAIDEEYDRTEEFTAGYAKAMPWYCRAALAGHQEAQVAGGSMLIQGAGTSHPVQGLAPIGRDERAT